MHASAFDRFQHRYSIIHTLDPRVKVVFTMLFIVSNVLLPDGAWLGFLFAFFVVLACSRLAKLPATFTLKRSLIALPFALAAVTTMISIPGNALTAIQVGPWLLIPTDAGVLRFISIVMRSLLSVQMAILLTTTTQFHDLIHAFRHLRLPQPLVATIAFMYRYLFILADEVLRLLRARESRSARLADMDPKRGIGWRAKVAGNMAGQLFIRSFERSDRVYNAMLSRGYTGYLMTLNPHVMERHDWTAMLVALFLLFLIQLSGRLL